MDICNPCVNVGVELVKPNIFMVLRLGCVAISKLLNLGNVMSFLVLFVVYDGKGLYSLRVGTIANFA